LIVLAHVHLSHEFDESRGELDSKRKNKIDFVGEFLVKPKLVAKSNFMFLVAPKMSQTFASY